MSQREFVVKQAVPRRILALTGLAARQAEVPQVVGPMFGAVADAIRDAGERADLGIASYAMRPDGGLDIVAGFVWDGAEIPGFDIIELPEVLVASTTHYGVMATIGESWGALMRWVDSNGFGMSGPGREIYLKAASEHQRDWVTELQQPIVRR